LTYYSRRCHNNKSKIQNKLANTVKIIYTTYSWDSVPNPGIYRQCSPKAGKKTVINCLNLLFIESCQTLRLLSSIALSFMAGKSQAVELRD